MTTDTNSGQPQTVRWAEPPVYPYESVTVAGVTFDKHFLDVMINYSSLNYRDQMLIFDKMPLIKEIVSAIHSTGGPHDRTEFTILCRWDMDFHADAACDAAV